MFRVLMVVVATGELNVLLFVSGMTVRETMAVFMGVLMKMNVFHLSMPMPV